MKREVRGGYRWMKRDTVTEIYGDIYGEIET